MALLWRCRARTFIVIGALMLMLYSGFQLMYLPVQMEICPDPLQSPDINKPDEDEESDITLVTMYLNIGSFKKTSLMFFTHESYGRDHYKSWLFSWAKLHNKVVAFFDDDEFIEHFKKVRFHLPDSYTTIVKISRDELKAFDQLDRIEKITSNPSFTVSYPAVYTCTMNAKYDALDIALKRGLVKTKHAAWIDVGLWRKLQDNDMPFTMKLPPDFNSSKIGFSQVTPHEEIIDLSPSEMYRQNIVWVAGGFVLGTKPILQTFLEAYRIASEELQQQGLADTDQQVVASMYSPSMAWKQKVEVMTYACPRGSFGLFGYAYLYFCLPYICRASEQCRNRVPADQSSTSLSYFPSISQS